MKNEDSASIEVRIRKLSRKILCDVAITKDGLRNASQYFKEMSLYYWEVSESIDKGLKKKLKVNPKWKQDRPKVADIRAEESKLKDFVGDDLEKLVIFEKLTSLFSFREMMEFPERTVARLSALEDIDAKAIRRALRVLLRGKPGRHPEADKQDFAAEADRLSKSGWSSAKIAQQKLPDFYAKDPLRASARVRSALKRYRKHVASTIPPESK